MTSRSWAPTPWLGYARRLVYVAGPKALVALRVYPDKLRRDAGVSGDRRRALPGLQRRLHVAAPLGERKEDEVTFLIRVQ